VKWLVVDDNEETRQNVSFYPWVWEKLSPVCIISQKKTKILRRAYQMQSQDEDVSRISSWDWKISILRWKTIQIQLFGISSYQVFSFSSIISAFSSQITVLTFDNNDYLQVTVFFEVSKQSCTCNSPHLFSSSDRHLQKVNHHSSKWQNSDQFSKHCLMFKLTVDWMSSKLKTLSIPITIYF
jgi:hypothetical protein